MFNGKMLRQMSTEGLHPIALAGMVPSSEIMDSIFACNMHGGFGYLTADKSVQTEPGRGFQV